MRNKELTDNPLVEKDVETIEDDQPKQQLSIDPDYETVAQAKKRPPLNKAEVLLIDLLTFLWESAYAAGSFLIQGVLVVALLAGMILVWGVFPILSFSAFMQGRWGIGLVAGIIAFIAWGAVLRNENKKWDE